jgi:curved DNA-binding protein CbpA
VHDYFEILGVSRDARPSEIRRACGRRARATHPDVWDGDPVPPLHRAGASSGDRTPVTRELSDAAIDFVDPAAFVDAMRASFFA